jgi:hypothetical protein
MYKLLGGVREWVPWELCKGIRTPRQVRGDPDLLWTVC